MRLNYSKEMIDSEFDLFQITNECDCKYRLYVQLIANVCVCVCVWARVWVFESVCMCVCLCARAHVCVCVHACVCVWRWRSPCSIIWSPCSIITIIFPFTLAPVNDDDVWELHTWESDVFMWRAARDWVLKSVRVHGMHTSPLSRKNNNNKNNNNKKRRNTGADKREKVLIARECLESLTKLPSHYCQKDSLKLPWNCDYFMHTYDQSVSRVLQFQRKSPSVQTSFTRGNEDGKHCYIQTPKKISTICVLDINVALSPNRT